MRQQFRLEARVPSEGSDNQARVVKGSDTDNEMLAIPARFYPFAVTITFPSAHFRQYREYFHERPVPARLAGTLYGSRVVWLVSEHFIFRSRQKNESFVPSPGLVPTRLVYHSLVVYHTVVILIHLSSQTRLDRGACGQYTSG